MSLIIDNAPLAAFCDRLSQEKYVTVDTEFLREQTYWPELCLVQVGGSAEAAAIDALAPGIDLTPLFDLLRNPNVTKVFHAARQDVEIFLKRMGTVPTPLFDTQIAAMVCGFGDQVGYETLAKKLAKATIDKSSRFTDWSLRPLTGKQLNYALSDVTHLRPIYEKLARQLDRTGRASWLAAEMEALAHPSTYQVEPRDAWRRLKVRTPKPRFLAVLREVAAWRESYAQEKDVPRNRILRDEAVVEIAAHTPSTVDQLVRVRSLSRKMAEGHQGKAILEAVARGTSVPPEDCPTPPSRPDLPRGLGPVVDLLKVLLKMKCEEHDVAQRLVASAADLELIAADDSADVQALTGWRRELFGDDAIALKHGRLALTVVGQELKATPVGG